MKLESEVDGIETPVDDFGQNHFQGLFDDIGSIYRVEWKWEWIVIMSCPVVVAFVQSVGLLV